METKIAVFLDRDGVINNAIERGSPTSPEGTTYTAPWTVAEFEVFPDSVVAIERIRRMGLISIVVTNQPDVRYGNMTPLAMNEVMRQTRALGFDDVFICPHGRDEGCACKKPKPGMLHDAASKWNVDLSRSYIIGDTKSDTGAGKAAGCRTILIARPYNEEDRPIADVVVGSLLEAVDWIAQDRA